MCAALLALALAACGRASRDAPAPSPETLAIHRRRCLELIDTLPRLEAEQRAWPRSESLACDEHGEARAREVDQLIVEMERACADLPARAALKPAFDAAEEVKQCAACAPAHARHCTRARELLVDAQLALASAGLR